MSKLADQLRELLKASGLKSPQVAVAVGMHEVSVRRFRGGGGLSLRHAERLATILGMVIVLAKSKPEKDQSDGQDLQA